MSRSQLLPDLIIILSATLPVSYLFHRFKLPAVIGYLLTGVLIGPFGIGLISNYEDVETMAEIGVVVLLFTIGLEFSLVRMMKNLRLVIGGGGLQVLFTIIGVCFVTYALGKGFSKSLFYGFLVSLSSTAIIFRIYIDRDEIETPHGKIVVGILLFQDLCVLPMMLIVPVLSATSSSSLNIFLALFKATSGVVFVFFAARFFVPKLLFLFAKLRSRESMILLVILLCLGIAFLTEYFGFSLAMGAFIAGLIISESEYSQQIVVEMLPFRDFFSSIFFISIGMLLSVGFLIFHLQEVLLMSGSIIFLKAVCVFLGVSLVVRSFRVSFVTALRLAQVGEFSFIMAGVGLSSGLINDYEFKMFISCAILTMFIAPILFFLSDFLEYKIFPNLKGREIESESEGEQYEGHVIIAGYGLNGQNLTRVLKETRIKYLVVDISAEHLKQGRSAGVNIMYGDITRREIMLKAGVKNAKVVVFAISDAIATRRGLTIVKQLNPNAYTLIRTTNLSEVDELRNLGADQVIPMEFETSVEIFSRVLKEFNVPGNIINQYVEMIRTEGYGMLRGLSLTNENLRELYGYLAKSTTMNHMVMANSPASDKTLIDVDLRRKAGAVILAIVRGKTYFPNPDPQFRIAEGDLLVIAGSHAQLTRAEAFLSGNDSSR